MIATSNFTRFGYYALVLLLIASCFMVAAVGYQHSLPYIDYADEMTIWTMGRSVLDPTWVRFQPEYPPAFPFISSLIQRGQIAAGDPFINPAGAVAITRLLSVLMHTGTMALILYLTFRITNSKVAAFFAGLFWAVMPMAIQYARSATVDATLSLWFIATVAVGFEGWRRQSVRWIVFSLLLAMLTALFKWQGAAVLGVPPLVALTFWRTDRRKVILLWVSYGLVMAVFGYWAVVIHGALRDGTYYPGTEIGSPTITTLLTNLEYQLFRIGNGWIFGFAALLGMALSLLPDIRKRLHIDYPLWIFPLVLIAFNAILSFNGAPVFERHYLAAMTLQTVLAGICVWRLIEIIRALKIGRYQQYVLVGVLLVMVSIPIVQMAQQVVAFTSNHLLPDRRNLLTEWARTTVLDGNLLVTDGNLASAFDPLYGYRGRAIPESEQGLFVIADDVTDDMLQNVRYVVAVTGTVFDQLTTPLTRLISYPDNQRLRGTTWEAYFVGELPLNPPEDSLPFGDELLLRGYSFSPQQICRTDAVEMRLVWSAPKTPSRYYAYFLHLASPETGEIAAPINGLSPLGDERPTITWSNPSEILVSPLQHWMVPEDIPAGTYALWLGVFEPLSGAYLYTPDGLHYHVLSTQLEIEDC